MATHLNLLRKIKDREPIDDYIARLGYSGLDFVRQHPEQTLYYLKEGELRGKGGAGFPAFKKWETVQNADGKPLVICNAAEGEVGLAKDKELLVKRPHIVLEGMLIAAKFLETDEIIIALKDTYAYLKGILDKSINELMQLDMYKDINDIKFTINIVPHSYVTGEETALLEVLEGRESKPRFKPPIPATEGLYKRPTLVHNVETLARAAAMFHRVNNDDQFRSKEIGSVLLTLEGDVCHPGTYEFPMGTSIEQIVQEQGTPGENCFAVRIGGYFGKYFKADQIKNICLSYEDLKSLGASMGCGTLTVFNDYQSVNRDLAAVTSFFAKESCGQCVPCKRGTSSIANIVNERDGNSRDEELINDIQRYTKSLYNRGACGFLNGAAGLVDSFCDNILSQTKSEGEIVNESAY